MNTLRNQRLINHTRASTDFLLLFLTTSSVTQPCLILAWSLLEVLKIIPRGSAGIWDYMSLTLPNTICKFLSRSESPIYLLILMIYDVFKHPYWSNRVDTFMRTYILYGNNFLRQLIIARELGSCKIMFCILVNHGNQPTIKSEFVHIQRSLII